MLCRDFSLYCSLFTFQATNVSLVVKLEYELYGCIRLIAEWFYLCVCVFVTKFHGALITVYFNQVVIWKLGVFFFQWKMH